MWLLMLQFGVALLAFFIIAIVHWIYKWRNPPHSLNGMQLPPGSMGLPLIGETMEFIIPTKSFDLPFFLEKRMKKFGTLFKTCIFGRPIVVSTDPEFNYYILLQEGKSVELCYLDAFRKILGHDDQIDKSETKLNAYGHIHKYLRILLSNYIGSQSLKQKLFAKLYAMVDENLNAWTCEESVDLKQESSKMVFAFTAKLILSYDVKYSEDLTEDFLNLTKGFLSWPINIPGTDYHSSLKSRTKLFKIFYAIVKERIQSPANQNKVDIMDELVHDMQKQEFITKQFITGLIVPLLLAAVEGLSTALAMSVKFITENPKVIQELEKEYKDILQKRSTGEVAGLTWEEYKSMTYTEQVIKETLRLSSHVPATLRRAVKDIHHSNGYTIPKGWFIMIAPNGLHLNPDIYEDHLAFKPSRWEAFVNFYLHKMQFRIYLLR